MPLPVSYRVSMSAPHSHLFEVQAHFPACGDEVIAAFPVWTPGSYLIREYARHVQDLKATTITDEPLTWRRLDKHRVQVKANNKAFRLHYRVYANELTVRTSHLDGTHGYFNGATLFFYVETLRGGEHRVAVHAPNGWSVTAALNRQGIDFVAGSYDELVDTPFEVSPHTALKFTAAQVPHELVTWGDPVLDEKKAAADLTRVCEAAAEVFGGLPMPRYVFFLYATEKGRGGLEHAASTALIFPRSALQTPRGWEDFLTLAAHEYFHLWNVKRIKPRAFVPFRYDQENYTTLLWAFEGGTSYYDSLLVRRAGLMSAQRYLTRLGETMTALHTTPGRNVMPLLDASWLSWVKYYRADEHTPNSAISYYVKGEVVCLLLDLHIRKLTDNQKSLDDVMRALWAAYGDGSGVPEDGVERAAEEVAGQSLRSFFDAALRGTGELDYSVLSHVGLEAKFRVRESATDKGGSPPRLKGGEERARAWLGVVTKGNATIASVFDGSPAARAGLYADDDLVALDGTRVDASGLIARTEEKKAGDRVRVTVFRRDRLLDVDVTLDPKPLDAVYIARTENPTDAQKRAYKLWLGVNFEEGSAEKAS